MTQLERLEIERNVAAVREKIAAAAIRAGKQPEDIMLVAATKMNDAERVQAAIQAGIDVCGENRVQELLGKYEGGEKEPGTAASVMSWMGTELKLMWKGDSHQIAKILMDGCNMGIQSVSEYENKYVGAVKESKDLAKKLVTEEEGLMKKLKEFL